MAAVTVRWRAALFDDSQIWKEIQTWHWQELDCSKKILVKKEMRITMKIGKNIFTKDIVKFLKAESRVLPPTPAPPARSGVTICLSVKSPR